MHDIAVRGAPRNADDETALIHGEDGTAAVGAAFEKEIDVAIAEPDGPGLRDKTRFIEQS
jgi:hypothetical protein